MTNRSSFFQAIFLLIGSTVGAGIFALPYAFSRSGVLPAILEAIVFSVLIIGLNLAYAKVIVADGSDRQLSGYAEKYLGKTAKFFALFTLFSCYGALLAYVILGGEFLALVLGQRASFWHYLFFYLFRVFLFYQGFKKILKIESILVTAMIVLMLVLPVSLAPFLNFKNFVKIGPDPFFSIGTVLFALTSFSAIPEVEEALRKKRHLLPPAIIVGGVISLFLSLIFSFVIWGAAGATATSDALSGLLIFSPFLVRLGALVGLLIMTCAFLNLSNVVKEIYYRDLGFGENFSRFLAVFPPFFGIFSVASWFLKIVNLTGVLSMMVVGTLISLMAVKIGGCKFLAVAAISLVFFASFLAFFA